MTRTWPRLLVVSLMASHAAAAEEYPVVAEVKARDAEVAAAHGRGDMAAYRAGLSVHCRPHRRRQSVAERSAKARYPPAKPNHQTTSSASEQS